MHLKSCLPLVYCAAVWTASQAHAADFADLLLRVPESTNTLVLIDAEALLKSDLARKNDWSKKLVDAYLSDGILLPPGASRLVLAAELDALAEFQPAWELALLDLEEPISLTAIAKSSGGKFDKLDGVEMVRTERGALVIPIGKQHVAGLYPGNRQFTSRWLRAKPELRLSPYLQEVAAEPGTRGQILLAIDLENVLEADMARERLADNPDLGPKKRDLDALAAQLTTLRGLSLRINVTDKARGEIKVCFKELPASLLDVAKPVLLGALDRNGAMLDDLEAWKLRSDKDGFILEGDVSPSMMRRVLSVIQPPQFAATESAAAAPTTTSPEDAQADATLTYYKKLSTLIEECRTELHNTRSSHAYWSERYAAQIDKLPLLSVDPELLTYSANVSGSLRYQAVSKRQAGLRQGVKNTTPNYGTVSAYGPFGGYAWSTVKLQPERTFNQRVEMAKFQDVRLTEWQAIDASLLQLRRTLTERYQREF